MNHNTLADDNPELPDFSTKEEFRQYPLTHKYIPVKTAEKNSQWCATDVGPKGPHEAVRKLWEICQMGDTFKNEAKDSVKKDIKCCATHWNMVNKRECADNLGDGNFCFLCGDGYFYCVCENSMIGSRSLLNHLMFCMHLANQG